MCICLPNGKFNFKFPRSYNCTGKKGRKSKRALSLISECSEEDDLNEKLHSKHKNGIKKDIWNEPDCENNQGQIRQVSRDRQLPPVPDAVTGGVMQVNSPRKSTTKNNNSHSVICGKGDQFQVRKPIEEESSIYESGTYAESKSATQSPCSKLPNQFPMLSMEDTRDLDPLYSSVLSQTNKSKGQGIDAFIKKPQAYKFETSQTEQERLTKEYLTDKMGSDHLYSTIVKNDFNSLRKPNRPHSAIRDYPYQSLQSLNNQAPVVPLRLYKLSELTDLINYTSYADSAVKLRKCTPADSKSNSLRRFSQPNSTNTENDQIPQTFDEGQREVDVLRRIQSQYNTPPITRASLSDVRQLHLETDASSLHSQCSSKVGKVLPNSIIGQVATDCCDHNRHSALPEVSGHSDGPSVENARDLDANIFSHVYEGLYETLYYSSAEPGRRSRDTDDNLAIQSVTTEIPNPLSYLGQDNYLSISDNPSSTHFNIQNVHSTNHSFTRPLHDRSSAIYTTTGSDVYAEISDAYLSKQYEELPEQRQSTKGCGQINSGYVGSPGTLRVLLEIQSFRHMDSDVDVSSRCATPLHPLVRAVTGPTKADNEIANATIVRHPWFLPQRSSDEASLTKMAPLTLSSTLKTRLSQTHLAIMTPLMERSMEDSRGQDRDLDEYDPFRRRGSALRLAEEEEEEMAANGDCVAYPRLSQGRVEPDGGGR